MRIPYQLLHTYVVVARCGRMNLAAQELSVTPGAISQRIKELEGFIGQALLVRSHNGLCLTRAGKRLLERIDAPFIDIENAYKSLDKRSHSRQIVIDTTPALALNWLVPRLTSFRAANSTIEVVVESGTKLVDLRAESVDLAIRHGLGAYPGLVSHWLMAPEQIVVGSPALLSSGRQIQSPEDCLYYPLLHDVERKDWELWLRALGHKKAIPLIGQAFSDDNLLVRAAVASQGLALVSNVYAMDEISQGRLMQVLPIRWPTQFAYYLVGSRATFRRPVVQRFRSWLSQEAAEQ